MSRFLFALLAMLILSLLNCNARNVDFGHNDGSHSDEADHSIRGSLLNNQARFPRNIKTPATDSVARTKFNFKSNLIKADERYGDGINGSATTPSRNNSSCAVASVPCSCVSDTGICTCTTTDCICTVAPCAFKGSADGSAMNSTRASSSSSSSGGSSSGSSTSSSSSSSSSTSSSSSGSTSISTVCTGIYAVPACVCYVTTCINGVCTNTTYANTSGTCAG